MQAQKPEQKLAIDIHPTQYTQKNTKQLGNHFIYSKLDANTKWNDSRLRVLNPDYFQDKVILDIGCNEGVLAIPIAIKYQAKMVYGVDIGQAMVKKAKANIESFVNKNHHYKYPKQIIDDVAKLPLYFRQKICHKYGEIVYELEQKYQLRPKDTPTNTTFPKNIQISLENILAPSQFNKYECIMCMNVTKWIHLAYGDEGIKKLFENIEKMSDDGTILILECQPWSSYRKKKNLYPSYSYNYRMILQKPERFKDYLYKLGFRVIEQINPNSENTLKHQILILQKKCSTKSHQ